VGVRGEELEELEELRPVSEGETPGEKARAAAAAVELVGVVVLATGDLLWPAALFAGNLAAAGSSSLRFRFTAPSTWTELDDDAWDREATKAMAPTPTASPVFLVLFWPAT
jgi:hypothetical protein